MKLTFSFALLALTSAAHQAKQQTDSTDAQQDSGAAQQDSGAAQQDTGYGGQAQDTGYQAQDAGYQAQDAGYQAQDAGYEAAPMYQEHTFAPRVEICLGNCPKGSHCQNKATGACSAPVQYSAPQYSGEVSYGAAQSSAQGYGAAQSSAQGYGRKLQGGYAAPSYEPDEAPSEGSCPEGSINLNCAQLGRRTVLWVAFALLAIPALYFWYVAFHDPAYANLTAATANPFLKAGSFTKESLINAIKGHRSVSFGICFIASLAYLTMALGYGFTTRCCDGRQFYYARYIDWAITTPLMIWKIVERTEAQTHEKYFLISMDILMVVAGLIGSLVCGGNDKWVFFGFSMLCFLPVMYFIWQLREKLNDSNNFKAQYDQVITITIVTWLLYPVVWILAEGTGTICAQAEAICYTVLDILAKSLFGFVLVQGRSNYIGTGLIAGSMI